jgi:predicted RNA-binding Zn-ribbon protein involved in translation (DUF1610 family)
VASLLIALFVLAPAQEIERESYGVYLCPIHRDEQATGPRACTVCGRDLAHRILAPSFSCPMHQSVDEESAGSCPICGMSLVPTTRELQWFCPGPPEILASEPGTCPDGAPMEMRSLPMAHGDHNPKHGGILFMAPNGYHHIEGTLEEDGTFRLYLYDDFTKPIDPKGFDARIEGAALVDGGGFLQASLPTPLPTPAEVVLHVRFPGSDGNEARFDFIFATESAPSLALPEFRIPETEEEIRAAIHERNERVLELIRRGSWPDLYIPALEAKDLVLALSAKAGPRVALPAKKLVRAAWLLDFHGDAGNRLEVETAYRLFEESIRELEEAYAP